MNKALSYGKRPILVLISQRQEYRVFDSLEEAGNKLGRVRRFRAETDQASDALDKRIRFTSKFVASLRFKSFLHADGAYCRRYGCGESDDSIGTKNPAKIQRILAGRYSDVERSDAGGQT